MHLLPFPYQIKKHVEDEKSSHFMDVIQMMYIHIPMLDAIQVPTYAKYLRDILNQKRPMPEMDRLLLAEKCTQNLIKLYVNWGRV
jgi:tRNA isopentenyl-2-thiomethyl-A-37 hydroxylase MiaE